MNVQKYYLEATKHFINYSSNDATATIAREHGLIGLTRLLACLDYIGIPYDETYMIALPDFTFTRNPNRWNSGFPYGCIIVLPKLETPFIPIDFRPNCCGVTFAKISPFKQSPDLLCKKYYSILNNFKQLAPNDLNKRNHFLGIYIDEKTNEYYCLLHCSFKFVKQTLYSEYNDVLSKANNFTFMSGDIHFLYEESAQRYYNTYLKLNEQTLELRKMIVESLFDEVYTIFNKTHEGFMDINTILLGAYADNIGFKYPLMLKPDSDLYVIETKKKLRDNNSNVFYGGPHGGGYMLESVISASTTSLQDPRKNEYVLSYTNNCSFITNNILDMPFNYRNNTVEEWCFKYDMANVRKRLKPIINLKL